MQITNFIRNIKLKARRSSLQQFSGMGLKRKKKAYRKALAEPRGAGGASPRSAEGASEARGVRGHAPPENF